MSRAGGARGRRVCLRRALQADERPCPDHFAEQEFDLPASLQPGQLLVRVVYVSVDPYAFQYALRQEANVGAGRGAQVQSRAVGVVVAGGANTAEGFPVGALVYGSFGWASHGVVDVGTAAQVTVTMADGSSRTVGGSDGFRRLHIDAGTDARVSLRSYLGVLGVPGLTAYAGVSRLLAPVERSRVFISTAAGAVGLAAAQVARCLGASYIVGSTGSDAKASFLLRNGFDAAINYKTGRTIETSRADPQCQDVVVQAAYESSGGGTSSTVLERYTSTLAKLFGRPEEPGGQRGIDGYLDCVGGVMLDAVLGLARQHARVAVCGIISTLPTERGACGEGDGSGAAVGEYEWRFKHFEKVLTKQIAIRGFQARDHFDLWPEYEREMGKWLHDGRASYEESVRYGLENCVGALLEMLHGCNTGKQLVQISEDPTKTAAAASGSGST